jgi:hypothetical protein
VSDSVRELLASDGLAFSDAFSALVDSGSHLGDDATVGDGTAIVGPGFRASAADHAIVLAAPGSTITAWSGALVIAADGATVRLGSGASAWVLGSSQVVVNGWTGVEFRGRGGTALVIARGGARIDSRNCDVIADDADVRYAEGMSLNYTERTTITVEEPRQSTRVAVAFSTLGALERLERFRAGILAASSGVRSVYSAWPASGQSREEWLQPVRRAVRKAARVVPLHRRLSRRMDWDDARAVLDRVTRDLAIPPTISDDDLRL